MPRADSDDPKYQNYRTSQTGSLRSSNVRGTPEYVVHTMSQQFSRLPTLGHVETPQLLKYVPGAWYKTHQDCKYSTSTVLCIVPVDTPRLTKAAKSQNAVSDVAPYSASYDPPRHTDFHSYKGSVTTAAVKVVEPNRHCTMLFYLNEVEGGGGETVFPEALQGIPNASPAAARYNESSK